MSPPPFFFSQYSLEWFIQLFVRSICNSEASHTLETRIQTLNSHFTHHLFNNVCRSLFEKHKLLFSFLLTIKILQAENRVKPEEWRFLLTGGVAMDKQVRTRCLDPQEISPTSFCLRATHTELTPAGAQEPS